VIGDAYSVDEVEEYVAVARDIQASYPESELVIVPKCRAAIHAIPEDLIVGYSRGYADKLLTSFRSRLIGVVDVSIFSEGAHQNN